MKDTIDKISKKENKNIRRIIMMIIIIIIILLLLIRCNGESITFIEFAERLHTDLNNIEAKEGEVEDKYIEKKFGCENVVYYGEIIEFYKCEVEENKIEDYCIYDGEKLYCDPSANDKATDFIVEYNSDYEDYSKENIALNLEYDRDNFSEVLYCTTTENKCIPDKNLPADNIVELKNESITNKVCLNAIANTGKKSEIVCSDNYIIDKTQPLINDPIIEGSIGNNGWYISDVVIKKVEAVDEISGILSTELDKTLIDYNTDKEIITVTATDNALNAIRKEYVVKVDKSNPTNGAIKVEGIVGNNNWYRSDVKITFSEGYDSESGYDKSILSTSSIKNDTQGTKVNLTTYDKAGNASTINREIKIDSKEPVVSGLSDIYISRFDTFDYLKGVEATDVTSGIAGDINVDTSSIDMNNPGTYYATYEVKDQAGNVAVEKRKVIVSEGAFNVNFITEINPNENKWFNENIKVKIEIDNIKDSDAIKYCTTTKNECEPSKKYDSELIIENESESNKVCMIVEYSNKDTSDIVCSEIYQLDKTAPIITNVEDAIVNINEYIITNDYLLENDLSGIKDIKITGDVITGDTISVDTNSAGLKVIYYEIEDFAGNISNFKREFNVKSPLPEIYFDSSSTELNHLGWANDYINIKIEGVDYSNTGIKEIQWCIEENNECHYKNYNTNEVAIKESGENIVVCARIIDNADQESEPTCTNPFKLDKEYPIITLKEPIVITEGDVVYIKEYLDVIYGISGGNITCTYINTDGLKSGNYDAECIATSNAGKTSKMIVPITVNPVSKEMISGNDFNSIIGEEKYNINYIVFNNINSSDYEDASIKYDFSKSKNNSIIGYIEGMDGYKFLNIQSNDTIIANSDLSNMFKDFILCEGILFNNKLNTDNTNNMSSMFEGMESVTYLNLSSLNFNNVNNVDDIFNWESPTDYVYVATQEEADKLNASLNKYEPLIIEIISPSS